MSNELELNENMTSDEIAAYANAVVEEIEKERKGEQKSDAEIISSVQSDSTPTEVNSGGDSAESDDSGEVSSDNIDLPKWVDDDVLAEATAYGVSKKDLQDFASREELERAFRLFDKTALEAGRKALVESDEKPTRNEKGQFVKKDEQNPESPKEETRESGRYEIQLNSDLYDEEIIGEFSRMRDHYESRLSALESYISESRAIAEEKTFDSFVDKLGYSELFGTTGKESGEELSRRKDLLVAVKAQMIGLERLGRPTEMTDQLVSRVANMVFADEFNKKRLKQHTQKISRQSQLRQGGSPTKPLPPRDDPREEADRLYREYLRN